MADNIDGNGQYEYYLDEYARIVQTVGTDTYIAHALAGSSADAAVWRVQKIDTNGSQTWADGDTKFNNVATVLSGLNYS